MPFFFTITVDDANLDAFAELVVGKLLDHAPGLVAVDAPEGEGEPAVAHAAGAPARKAAAKPKPAAQSKPAPETQTPAPETQTPAQTGAVIDPRTHRMVEAGATTNAPEPANPAPEPS